MRIGFNGRYVQKTLSGIEYYLLNLISELGRVDRDNEYFIFINRNEFENGHAAGVLSESGANVRVSGWPSGSRLSRLIWDYMALGADLRRERIDLFHGPSFSVPLVKTCPCVVTVHDMAFRHTPESYTHLNRYYFKVLLPSATRKSRAIITDSINSKKDIVEMLPVDADKVHVVYPGVDPDFKIPGNGAEGVEKKYKIGGPFILTVSGLITPRKNLDTLIRAYNRLKKSDGFDRRLVVVGKEAWSYRGVFELVEKLGLQKDVLFTGPVPKEDLIGLYSAAELFAFPSLYEGFGFPVLEAMAIGTPVVCSDVSSLPELAGDACLLINPLSEEELAAAIAKVAGDKSLSQAMSIAGKERSKKFTWRRAAERTLEVYRQAVADA